MLTLHLKQLGRRPPRTLERVVGLNQCSPEAFPLRPRRPEGPDFRTDKPAIQLTLKGVQSFFVGMTSSNGDKAIHPGDDMDIGETLRNEKVV